MVAVHNPEIAKLLAAGAVTVFVVVPVALVHGFEILSSIVTEL